jgi:hypothetical protein
MDLYDDLQMEAVIEANSVAFDQLVAKAESGFRMHDWEAAAVYSQMAAHFAWCNHPGLFASRRLESILLRLGGRREHKGNAHHANSKSTESPTNVLHVLTKALSVGGHTRLVSRWIEHDAERVHSVVLTRQEGDPIPGFLEDSVLRSNGKISLLDEKPGGLLRRAKRLRRIAGRADLIILHIHPYDVVPIIALADRPNGPAVVFLNHADHVFWLGYSVSDLVAHVREGSLNTSLERRGITAERCCVLPIPLRLPSRTLSRADAKRVLGLDPTAIVLLSVASDYKFQTNGPPSFASVLLPVLQEHEKAVMVAVGPSHRGDWAEAAKKTKGRVRAVGINEDPGCFFQAADIYLDSFPFGSLTSLLEAGSHGLPLVYSHPYATALSLLRCDDLALESNGNAGVGLDAYRHKISELIKCADVRQRLGGSIKQSIVNTHMTPMWKDFLSSLYLKAAGLPGLAALPPIEKGKIVTEQDRALTWMQTITGVGSRLAEIELDHMRLLSPGRRYNTWVRIKAADHTLPRRFLIPESLGSKNQARLEPLIRPFRHRYRPA